jgi:PAS domain S-box-containing protein
MNGQIHILIVDDSSADAELIARELQKGNLEHESKWAKSKQEFMLSLQNASFDIVLCDYKMPGFDALEVLQILKDINPDIPLIIVSGTIGEELAIEIMKQGAVDYIMKDRLSRLVPSIWRALDEKRLVLERRQVEKKVLESEEKFSGLFEHMTSGAVIYEAVDNGEDFVIRDFNPAAESIEKKNKNDVIGRRVTEVFTGVKALGLFELFQRVWKTGSREYQSAHIYKDERGLESYRENWVYKLPSGQIAAIYNDITERKMIESELLESREYLSKIINSISDPIFVKDSQHRLVLVNDAECALIGYPREEILGRTDHDFFPQEQVDIFWAKDEMVLKTGQEDMSEEVITDAKGVLHTIVTKKTLYTDKNGEKFIVGVIRDISERKKMEDALRASQGLLEGIMNAISVRVFWKDKSLIYLGCNAVFAQDAGFADPQEVIGKDDYQMPWHGQAELYRNDDLEVIQSGNSKFLIEEPQTTPAGGTVTLLTNKIPLRSVQGEIIGVLGTYFDISERKKMETESVKRARELEVFYKASIGREERIIELKKEIELLKKQLGR